MATFYKTKENRRKKFEVLRASLETERATFLPHWRDLSDFVLPRRAQFSTTDSHTGERRNLKIIDSTATLAARTLRSGMMGGMTSPARPWFKLATADPYLSEIDAVKAWLHEVTQSMVAIFLRSNLYKALPLAYGDMGTFATAAILVEEDLDTVVRFYTLPIGSYMLAVDERGDVRVFFREFRVTVRQLLGKFGTRTDSGEYDWSNFSSAVHDYYDKDQLDTLVTVCHVIQPNKKYNPKSLTSKRFESVYYEKGVSGKASNNYLLDTDQEIYLRDAGYDYFPVLAPRWEVTGDDVYGTECPGMAVLGDIKASQILQKRKAQAIEKMVNPPMTGPSALRTVRTSILPGDITYSDEREGTKGFRPVHEVNIRITELVEDIREHQARVQRGYYEDLFLMLSQLDRRQITAREVDERHEEKLLALGPVLEQLNQDLLDPLIDITFIMMLRQGLIPEPPEELQSSPLKVEYISVMHQAQKLAGLAGLERFTGYVATIAGFKPDVIDKFDADQAVDEYANITGVPPRTVVSDDAVKAIRQQRAQQQMAQQAAEGMAAGGRAAKDLSQADLGGDSALSALLSATQAGAVQ